MGRTRRSDGAKRSSARTSVLIEMHVPANKNGGLNFWPSSVGAPHGGINVAICSLAT